MVGGVKEKVNSNRIILIPAQSKAFWLRIDTRGFDKATSFQFLLLGIFFGFSTTRYVLTADNFKLDR
jgi:hypothetical protein